MLPPEPDDGTGILQSTAQAIQMTRRRLAPVLESLNTQTSCSVPSCWRLTSQVPSPATPPYWGQAVPIDARLAVHGRTGLPGKMESRASSNHLPEEANRFIGRERELSDLRLALGQARALTLCGAGGIGKTRLAMRLLAMVAGSFPDGVCLVELGDLWEPDLIVSRIASVVGVDGEPGRALLDTLAAALEARQLLIMLDNCEHLIDACASLCQRLLASCPSLRVLATSQEPLRIPPESVWQVAGLAVPPPQKAPDARELASYESVRLFADRARAARAGFAVTERNAMAVAAICRALDGVPLAIELAAARVSVLSAEQIAGRLGDRFALLASGGRAAPPRQRTLRATIDWSHDLLSPPERALLRRLSVFAGWSLEMAEQVCAGRGPVPGRDRGPDHGAGGQVAGRGRA